MELPRGQPRPRIKMKARLLAKTPMEISRALNLPPAAKERVKRRPSLGTPRLSPTPPPPPPPAASPIHIAKRPRQDSQTPTCNATPGPSLQAVSFNALPGSITIGTPASAFDPCPSPVFPWASLVPSMADPTQPTAKEREAARALLVVAETERFAPPPRRTVSTRRYEYCRCGKTKCLKLYCFCFRNDERCTSLCECKDCHNDGAHEEARMYAVRFARMNAKDAFAGTGLEAQARTVQREGGPVRKVYGCRCKRSQCRKKYCECFSAGLVCGANCICIDCLNVKA